jgi:hypothetical protein
VYFILWCPIAAPTTQKMLYSSEMRTLGSLLKGCDELRVTKRDDISVGVGIKAKTDAGGAASDDEDKADDNWMDD